MTCGRNDRTRRTSGSAATSTSISPKQPSGSGGSGSPSGSPESTQPSQSCRTPRISRAASISLRRTSVRLASTLSSCSQLGVEDRPALPAGAGDDVHVDALGDVLGHRGGALARLVVGMGVDRHQPQLLAHRTQSFRTSPTPPTDRCPCELADRPAPRVATATSRGAAGPAWSRPSWCWRRRSSAGWCGPRWPPRHPTATGQVTGFRVQGPHAVQVELVLGGERGAGRLHRPGSGPDPRRGRGDDGPGPGRRRPGGSETTVVVRTRARAVAAVVDGCTAGAN